MSNRRDQGHSILVQIIVVKEMGDACIPCLACRGLAELTAHGDLRQSVVCQTLLGVQAFHKSGHGGVDTSTDQDSLELVVEAFS
eukprot:6185930-Karenia_brevis.AAC.1